MARRKTAATQPARPSTSAATPAPAPPAMPPAPADGGDAPDKRFRQALIAELKDKGADLPELRAIARKAIDQALAGETQARALIVERLDGKAMQPLAGEDGAGPVQALCPRSNFRLKAGARGRIN